MTPFRVELSGMCRNQMLRTDEMQTEVFVVAARRRLLALPARSVRVMDGAVPEQA
jgi:hypothetical protein